MVLPQVRPVLNRVDIKEATRYAGLRGADFPTELVAAACREVLIYAKPIGSWEIYDYCAGQVIVADGAYIPVSKSLAVHLQAACKVAVLAVTIGEAVEERINALFKQGDYTLALLSDAAATALVEQAADAVCGFISNAIAKEGLFTGSRFSPGYGDWALVEQPEVLRLAGGAKIDMSTTAAFMLLPRKSVTAVVGLSRQQGEAVLPAACSNCAKVDCQLRKEDKSC